MQHTIKALLIEDDEDDFVITRKLLSRIEGTNFQIDWLKNYDDGLEAVVKSEHDICLLDYRLGERNGLEFLREAIQKGCKTPIILLTGSGDRAVDVEAAKAGASDYMVKGQISDSLLERSIRYSIESKKIEQSRDSALEAARQSEEKYLNTLIEKSEEKYQNVLETIQEGYFETDLKGNLTFFNDALSKLIGYNKDELIGQTYHNAVDEANAKKLFTIYNEVYKTGRSLTESSYEIIRKDGARRTLDSSVSLIRNAANEPIGFRGLVRDITARIEMEENLKEKERRLAEAQRTAHLGSWEWDVVENRVTWSEELYRIFGLAPHEFEGTFEAYLSYVHPEDREAVSQLIGQAVQDKLFPHHDTRIIRPDGVERTIYTTAVVHVDENGNPIKMTGIAQDITERKQAEADLQKNVSLLRSTFEATADGILAVDLNDNIIGSNKKFGEMLGLPEEFIHSRDSKEVIDHFLGLLKDPEGFAKVIKRSLEYPDEISFCTLELTDGRVYERYTQPQVSDGKSVGRVMSFRDITERKRAEEQLRHDAFHDGLTGLANRALFMDHLRMTIERSKSQHANSYAVLFLDFDRFKVVNDSLGHAQGDKLLKQIGQRLQTCMRTGDLLARLGGDEFVILLSELLESGDALRVAERIQDKLKSPFELAGREVFISTSIGIALNASGTSHAEEMLRDADIAMYRAKAKGKAQYQVFDLAMHEHASQKLQLETEMRHALERGEFELHYQPIIELETNKLDGFEALVRWRHPIRGMVSPMEFIPMAEETGLILPLGKWILHESCRQLREWQEGIPSASNLTVSVNLSCKQFLQSNLAEQVAEQLEASGLDPHYLKLEITESQIMENTEMAVAIINRLRDLGIKLSLDDFGTGYSSLSYLHRLPIDYLKIDRSFVSRMVESKENGEIVSTIIKLAQNLKMQVVAEGIETADQLAQLNQLNCEYGQGYFFSKPLEAQAAGHLIGSTMGNIAPVPNASPAHLNLICW